MSGSVCSQDFNSPQTCTDCASECLDEGYDKDTCCENFRAVEEFSVQVMNELTHSGNLGTTDKRKLRSNRVECIVVKCSNQPLITIYSFHPHTEFSIVSFGSTAQTVSALTDANNALLAINNVLDYSGGYTNHEQALVKCRETLPTGPDDPPAFILMVTDGVPTMYGPDGTMDPDSSITPRTKALEVANAIKADGIRIETLYVNPSTAVDESITNYMVALSSSPAYHGVGQFSELTNIVTQVSAEIGCNAIVEPEPEDEYLIEEAPAPEELDPPTTEVPSEEELILEENSDPSTWADPSYQEAFGTSIDIGNEPSTTPGLTSFSNQEGAMTVKVGHISLQEDQFHFAYEKISGNFDIMIRVEGFTSLEATARAGLMVRRELKPGSDHFSTLIAVSEQVQNLYRESNKAFTSIGATASIGAGTGVWLRIKKSAHNFVSFWSPYESPQGNADWTRLHYEKMKDMKKGDLYIGVAMAARAQDALTVSSFQSTHSNKVLKSELGLTAII